MSGLVVQHAVTRSVRDSAALLDATSGPDVGDPYCAPPPARPFLLEAGADPGKLRIAFTTAAATGTEVHADCIAAVQEAASLCTSLGHTVVEAAPAIKSGTDLVSRAFWVVWASGCAWTIDGIGMAMGKTLTKEEFEPLTWFLYEMGRKQGASNYLLSISLLQRVARDIARFFLEYDVLLTPTLAEPPVPLGTFDPTKEDPNLILRRMETFTPFTAIFNATGQPAMSVPLYWNTEGLPVGVQFVGRFGDEVTLIRLAAQLESARPWAGRRPPVSA